MSILTSFLAVVGGLVVPEVVFGYPTRWEPFLFPEFVVLGRPDMKNKNRDYKCLNFKTEGISVVYVIMSFS